MIALAAGFAALTTGAGLALAVVAPHALRPVLRTTAFILAASAAVACLFLI